MIAVVVVESLCGILCPLTAWEDRLRELAGEGNEPGSFVGRWMDRLLFVDVSPSVLAACYCVFGLAVLLPLMLAPPRWPEEEDEVRMTKSGCESKCSADRLGFGRDFGISSTSAFIRPLPPLPLAHESDRITGVLYHVRDADAKFW